MLHKGIVFLHSTGTYRFLEETPLFGKVLGGLLKRQEIAESHPVQQLLRLLRRGNECLHVTNEGEIRPSGVDIHSFLRHLLNGVK